MVANIAAISQVVMVWPSYQSCLTSLRKYIYGLLWMQIPATLGDLDASKVKKFF
ncbi:hypothetical protein J6590_035049 [Homalodisca vitripennis]|nr:hypothetical protein J6590_035049 [Homalodisca vitripennis]